MELPYTDKSGERYSEAVARFSEAMLNKMAKRALKYKPFGWRDPEHKTVQDLVHHLETEFGEYQEATEVDHQMDELVDIANTAFILWDRLRIDNGN